MDILQTLKQLRDDLKTWAIANLNALDAKIDLNTISVDSELDSKSTNPVQNKTITKAINNIPKFSGDYNDLTNAPNIVEDDSGNIIIADESGNIIFKADADGIHTTAVSLNGEAAATEKYVDEAVSNIDIPEVDFTGYATETYVGTAIDSAKEELSESIVAESDEWKVVDGAGNIIFSVDASGAHTTELTLNGEAAATEAYVDNAIANIDFPETDLTDYATKTYVTEEIAKIPKTDLTGYATEEYVNDAIANIDIPETDLTNYYTKTETETAINTAKEELSESIVAESEEWKVVDEAGNIIFSVDAAGAHTTNLTLNGESVEDIVDDKFAALVDSAPEALNTLNELAAALGDDPNFATTIATEIGKKVDKVDGKGLSTNDFTNAYKEKLDGLENIEFEESDPTVPAWAKEATKPSYTATEVGALADTTVLADLTDDATHRTVTDTEKAAWNAKSDFSGDYNDLENAPNITEDESNNLVITDPDGNIIFRSDADGFETTKLTTTELVVNGTNIEEALDGLATEAYVDEKVAETGGNVTPGDFLELDEDGTLNVTPSYSYDAGSITERYEMTDWAMDGYEIYITPKYPISNLTSVKIIRTDNGEDYTDDTPDYYIQDDGRLYIQVDTWGVGVSAVVTYDYEAGTKSLIPETSKVTINYGTSLPDTGTEGDIFLLI